MPPRNGQSAPPRNRQAAAPPPAEPAPPSEPPVPTTIDEIVDEMSTIATAAGEATITDDQANRYERLESALVAAQRSQNIAARQRAYETPVPGDLAAVAYAGLPRRDDTYNQAFDAYLRTGKPNSDLLNAQGVGTDPGGGFLVSPQFRDKLVEVQKAYGGLAGEVDGFTTDRGGDVEFPSIDDTASVGAITAEGAAFTTGTDMVFGTIAMKAWKYTSTGADASAGLRVSVELLQDSEFDIEALLARILGTRIARKQAVDWVTGAGTTLPFGIMHAGLTADVVLAAGNAVTYQKLLDLETALDPAYEQNAQWVMNKASWMKCRAVVDTTGRPLLFDANAGIQDQERRRTLLGYPVVIDQGAPSIGTLSARAVVLGDLTEAYVIRRVSQFAMVVNPYSRANFGQVEYVAWERADGNIQNRKAYALLQNNAA
ncbi:MAG TPA: phage major capsid protein [Actinoplanes sp.]|jgi:HK97 family phage major capsid protein|nr:phage major capsid protein [Actinoplanes sp.]